MPRVLDIRKLAPGVPWYRAKLPPNAVYVGRGSPWGNRFRIGPDGLRVQVVRKYKEWLEKEVAEEQVNPKLLKGADLVCFCHEWDGQGPSPEYCHADELLIAANR